MEVERALRAEERELFQTIRNSVNPFPVSNQMEEVESLSRALQIFEFTSHFNETVKRSRAIPAASRCEQSSLAGSEGADRDGDGARSRSRTRRIRSAKVRFDSAETVSLNRCDSFILSVGFQLIFI